MAAERLKKLLSVGLALILWQLAAMAVDLDFLFSSPIQVAGELGRLILVPDTWLTLAHSLGRVVLGFSLSACTAALAALAAYRLPLLDTLLWPYIAVMKSVPVVSFIIIALIWIKARNLSILISFLMVFPIIYTNLLQGLRSTDRDLLEMAAVYRIPWLQRLRCIYLPQLQPYLLSAFSVSLGISWKSSIAAEVIGIAAGTIGEKLYEAKIYFLLTELLAWTVLALAASMVFEKLVLRLLKKAFAGLEKA